MFLIYIAISLDKYLDNDNERRWCGTIMVIAVTTPAVLVVVGSVLSTQNG